MDEAVKAAKDADVVIAVVGINADWETESYDRKTLALPGRTDELVTKVAAVNPNTIVVTQAVSLIHSIVYGSDTNECSGIIYHPPLGRQSASNRSCMVLR